jgi:hypothetical protein
MYLGWFIFILVGLLQMFKVKGGIITNYVADIIAPVMLYYSSRKNKTVLSKLFKQGLNEKQAFLLIWILCIAWELLQKFDLSGTPLTITRGTFDLMDILVYTLTLLICYYFDVTRIQDVATAIPR